MDYAGFLRLSFVPDGAFKATPALEKTLGHVGLLVTNL